MTLNTLRVAAVAPDEPRASAKIARICKILDAEESQVRKLLDAGEIEGHGLGTRGVRIFLDSVAAYQDRRLRQPKGVKNPPRRRIPNKSAIAADREAMANLRRHGFDLPD